MQLQEFGNVVDETERHRGGKEELLAAELRQWMAHAVIPLDRHWEGQHHGGHTADVGGAVTGMEMFTLEKLEKWLLLRQTKRFP